MREQDKWTTASCSSYKSRRDRPTGERTFQVPAGHRLLDIWKRWANGRPTSTSQRALWRPLQCHSGGPPWWLAWRVHKAVETWWPLITSHLLNLDSRNKIANGRAKVARGWPGSAVPALFSSAQFPTGIGSTSHGRFSHGDWTVFVLKQLGML